MGSEVKEHLKMFSNYFESILRPSYILGYMSTWMPQTAIERIKAEEEGKGPSSAAELFMKKLLDLEDEGWYQGFIDSLRAAEYKGLSEALQKTDFQKIKQLQETKSRLQFIRATVVYNIKPKEVVDDFEEYLRAREIEEIKQETDLKGDVAGANKFVDCLLRSDEDWAKQFIIAMERYGHIELLQLWKGEVKESQNGKKEPVDETEQLSNTVMNIQFFEEPALEDQCMSAPEESGQDQENAAKLPKVASTMPPSIKNLKLRKYQEELALPAYSGKNTIICAPTGSGKTFVALSISDRHLSSMPEGKKGKIVFMATKVPVYEQQKNIFCQYFEDRYSVRGFCGEEAENVPLGMIIEETDIIVLTPQILLNSLDRGDISSLSVFTLMIFDECHNTIGHHPYNRLMFQFLDQKIDSPGQTRPQIVGLTASVGTGKSRSTTDAVQYIGKLCASLDIEVISTVKHHLDELQKVVYKPEKFIQEVGCRGADPFADIMSEIMKETEEMAKSIYPYLETLSDIQSRAYGTQKYEQWIIDIQKKCRLLQLEDKMEESRLCSALFTYTEHLRKFNDALMINEDARTKDALDYLQNFFTNIKNGTFTDIEQKLLKRFEGLTEKLLNPPDPVSPAVLVDEGLHAPKPAKFPRLMEAASNNENPKLEELQFILSECYRENPETRTLLFVKTRALVAALKKWVEETEDLSFLKPEVLIGRSKRHDNLGMTLPNQKGALETFRSSADSKLLIATSVADEGIDIPACNLVLLYEYVGNVTKMIQVRGRGRAHGSKCYLITSKKEQAERERNNLLHERLMNEAVAQLQKKDRTEFLKQNINIQREEKKMRDFQKHFKGRELSEENKRLLCGRCKTFACNTDDIRTINVSHHTVIDESFHERYFTKPHSKARAFDGYFKKFKIFCKNEKCGDDWGVSGNYQSFQNIPLIKIDKFVVQNANGSQEYFNKWVKVNFRMKEFKPEEIDKSFSAPTE